MEHVPTIPVEISTVGFTTDDGQRGTLVTVQVKGKRTRPQGMFIGAALKKEDDENNQRLGIKTALFRAIGGMFIPPAGFAHQVAREYWSLLRKAMRDEAEGAEVHKEVA